MGSRLHFIDYVRGIAALLVMTSHIFEIYITGWQATFEYLNMGQIGVTAFFLVSGYIIPYSLEKTPKISHFVWGRITRIYPLYIFVFCLMVAASYVSLYFPSHTDRTILLIILSHLLFIQDMLKDMPNYVMGNWTLLVEAIWYIFFSFLFFKKYHSRIHGLFLGFNSLLLFFVMISMLSGHRVPYGRLCLINICLLGYLLYCFHQKRVGKKEFYSYSAFTLLTVYIALYVTFDYFHNEQFGFQCVFTSWNLGIFLFFTFAFVRWNESTTTRILSFLGKISYSLYLVHPFVLYSVFHLTGSYNQILRMSFCYVFSILLSTATFYWVEKPAIIFTKKKLKADA